MGLGRKGREEEKRERFRAPSGLGLDRQEP
jgi:hypothetical protein